MHSNILNNMSVSERSGFTVNRLLENKYAFPRKVNKHGRHESAGPTRMRNR